ncbi:phospholipase A2 inhibitor and Ly6/PLAUR domain-containing protein-like [Hyla sarda]|uniref:phospholipase A2 inhibitor and Ly6/PLAUR domain-containing protein-like n=1 Tax=Hyla sarda TaxID=327740 RepID=UPI0024C44ADB|nr:phospholipase A2 inhibitor and Ly6/PLAUR domain-containing protein-like [Hyla sarda]XP_056400725.1 phospholipase A2 inhibitor and Ly6/PLAUR domain-containing protein-like [Hyla sarda]XP_056400726.1 phospholipase A2 inhibitor and Ly6/PLAUR domain-containing protein-like [Hyla sarda]XP_056400727.1 phospholipase A2 inhibitor and Ly6/PLAUR domain-containing protein-like [Hyla sarda]XP_056400728.1 phospholipase A2 inhibitor and Ly6/PLAUR domain-containing protein-like [Hyla sarda]XP_056400729.1 
MRAFLAIIFIISATIKAGNCVVCIECNNSTSPDCAGDLVTCGTCMTMVIETNSKDGNDTSYSVEKTCNFNSTICNITYSVNSDQFQARYTVNCCDTDYCNKNALEVTPWNNTENGVECPTCYAADGQNCTANNTVQCTGDENKCIDFSGKAPREGTCQTLAFQGCVTDLWCDHSGYLYPDNAECESGTMNCSNGRNSTHVQ